MEHVINDCICNGKKCPRCQIMQCRGRFYQTKHYITGKIYTGTYCRKCCSERRVEWQRENPERNKAGKREWIHNNQGRNNIATSKWRQSHPEAAKESTKSWYERYPEKAQAIAKVNRSKRRAHKRSAEGSFTSAEWEALKIEYNHTCLCCSKREPEISLTADHIIPLVKGGSNYIQNIQPLCHSCNSKKHDKIIDFRA